MIQHEVDPDDIEAISQVIERHFIDNPRFPNGDKATINTITPQESRAIVNRVLNELGRRKYAIALVPPVPEIRGYRRT